MAPASSHHTTDREPNQLGQRPTPPPEALCPCVAVGTGLHLTGQHRRTDERTDQCGHQLQYPAIRQKAAWAIEATRKDSGKYLSPLGWRADSYHVGVVKLHADHPRISPDRGHAATMPISATRCWRQVTQAIRRHGTGRRLASSSCFGVARWRRRN